MSKKRLAMPFRGEPRAHSFWCTRVESEKCRCVLDYVDFRSQQLWFTSYGYELGSYQRFKNENICQYPSAWKAGERRVLQLAHCCITDKVEHPIQLVPSPPVNDPAYAASCPRRSELPPAAAPYWPSPVVRHPALTDRRVRTVPAPVVRCAASRVCYVRAAPVDQQFHPAPDVCQDRPAPVFHHIQPVPAPLIRPVCTVPVDRPGRAAPVARHGRQALAVCCAVPMVRHDHAGPPQLISHPTLVPSASVPIPLPFPLCPTSTPSTSITAQARSPYVEVTHLEPAPVRHDSHVFHLNEGNAPEEKDHRQEDKQLLPCCQDEEDIPVQKEEGRG